MTLPNWTLDVVYKNGHLAFIKRKLNIYYIQLEHIWTMFSKSVTKTGCDTPIRR